MILEVIIAAHLMMSGYSALELETGWLSMITNELPLWNNSDAVGKATDVASHSHDNELEIDNSIKLIELLPQLKAQLESSNKEEKIRAGQFVKKMTQQIEENKRYTTMLWKGVKRIIDMGKVESSERRCNRCNMNIFLKIYLWIVNTITCWLFVDCRSPKPYAESLEVFDENGNWIPGGTKEQNADKKKISTENGGGGAREQNVNKQKSSGSKARNQ